MIRVLILYLLVLAGIVYLVRWAFIEAKNAAGTTRGYDELLLACSMDKRVAERLVKSQLKRRPGISPEEAVSSALVALRRDRGA